MYFVIDFIIFKGEKYDFFTLYINVLSQYEVRYYISSFYPPRTSFIKNH